MEKFLENAENFFGKIFDSIGKFFSSLWNGFIDLLSKFLPTEFATIVAVALLAIAVIALFIWFMNKDKR